MIRIIIADDHPIMRSGLKLILEQNDDFEVLYCAQDGEEAVAMTQKYMPDVVILDIKMPRCDGTTALKRIRAFDEQIKIIALTTFDDPTSLIELLSSGIDGYLLKTASDTELADAVRKVHGGMLVFDPAVKLQLQNITRSQIIGSMFTKRENDIIMLITYKKSNRQIAEELGIKEGTVKNVVSKILIKTCLNNRTELAEYITNAKKYK